MIRASLSFLSSLLELSESYIFSRNGLFIVTIAVGLTIVLYVAPKITRKLIPAGNWVSTLDWRAIAFLERWSKTALRWCLILLAIFGVAYLVGWLLFVALNRIDNDFLEFSLVVVLAICVPGWFVFVKQLEINKLSSGRVGVLINHLDIFLAERVAALAISYGQTSRISWLKISIIFAIAYAILILTIMPPVVTFALLGFLMVFTIAIHRRWSRTENNWDRLDAESLNPHVVQQNRTAADLSETAELFDEALLASVLLLLAFPQCLRQMNAWSPILSVPADVQPHDWYLFAFIEFLKEFPQVGWADVFDWKASTRRIDFLPSEHPTSDPARIVVFLMKVSIDFLVLNIAGSILGVRRSIRTGRRPTEVRGERLHVYGEDVLTNWTYAKLDTVRARGIEGLGFFTNSAGAHKRLLEILEERERPRLIAEAFRSLRKHNRKDEELAVRRLLHDPLSPEVLAEAIRSAHKYQLTGIDGAILAALKANSDVDVLRAAINAADALVLRDTRLEARPLLEALLGNERLRDSAIDALGKLGDATSVPALVKLAEKLDNRDDKERIARAIGKIGDETALPYLDDISIFGVSIPAGKGSPARREFVSGASEAIRSIKERVSIAPSSAPEKS